MHLCCDEDGMQCNAWCQGDLHADLMYTTLHAANNYTQEVLLSAAQQQHAERCDRAIIHEMRRAPEAPTHEERYSEPGGMYTEAYLILYTIRDAVSPDTPVYHSRP